MVTNQDTKGKFPNSLLRLNDEVTSPVFWDGLPLTEDLSPQHLAEPTLGRMEHGSPEKQCALQGTMRSVRDECALFTTLQSHQKMQQK